MRMEKHHARIRLFWKSLMVTMLAIGLLVIGYTAAHVEELPQLPDEMVLPLLSQKAKAQSTRRLINAFGKIRSLSEDYLIEKEPDKLASIKCKIDSRLDIINDELDSLSETDDSGTEILVANLLRLKQNLEHDMQAAFALHRIKLGLENN